MAISAFDDKDDLDDVVPLDDEDEESSSGIEDAVDESSQDDDEGGTSVDPPALTRRQKKAARYTEMKRRAEESERQMQQMREQLAAMQATQAAQMMQQRQQQTVDPEEQELGRLKEERRQIWREIQLAGDSLTPDRARQLEERVEQITDAERGVSVRREIQRMGLRPHDPHEQRTMELRIRHPDVFGNPRAQRVAAGYFDVEVGSGRVDVRDPASVRAAEDRAAERAREALGIATAPRGKPSDSRKARFAGPQASGGPADGSSRRTLKKTRELVKMANAMYDHIADPEKRWKAFATTVGKDMADNGEI